MAKTKTSTEGWNYDEMVKQMTNGDTAIEIRSALVLQWCRDAVTVEQRHICMALLLKLLNHDTNADGEVVEKLTKKIDELMMELGAGPQKEGSYLGITSNNGSNRALVEVDGGDRGYVAFLDKQLMGTLMIGDTVMVSMKHGVITGLGCNDSVVGEEVQFTRSVDENRAEVRTRGDEMKVVRLSHKIKEQVSEGNVKRGTKLITNRAVTLAKELLKPMEGPEQYRFLERAPVPDVVVYRDIGAPAKCIDEITEILRLEMTNPDLRRKYRMRRCIMKLLAGVSGAGKTLTIHAIWRRMYEVMSEVTGTPIEQLPPRVFWLRPGRLLSKWFGESENLIEQAMDEVQALADEKHSTRNGSMINLPVMVVMEEIDGIARSRGDSDQVYARVLTTLLQRLDPSQPALQQRLILFLGTTNEPGQVDRAFLRRIGGSVEQFGRLDKQGFTLVLEKHLRELPLASGNNHQTQAQLRRQFLDRLSEWVFDVEHDPGIVQIMLGGKEATCFRSDFLTGGLIDRAVQQSASEASDLESRGLGNGVTLQGLAKAIEDQLRQLGDQLTPENISKYMTLPDGQRCTKVVRIQAQPIPELAV